MKITASVLINGGEPSPTRAATGGSNSSPARNLHNATDENNADPRLNQDVMGREVIVAVTNGELEFDPREQVFYGEFDGNCRKQMLIKTIGE